MLKIVRKIWQSINSLTNGKLYLFFRFLVRLTVVPLTYFIWLIEPFKKIRFHRGQTTRIGHLASYFEVLVRSKEIDITGKKRKEIFIVQKNPPNKTLYNMWKKHFYFIESNKIDFIYHLCSPWLKNRRHFGPKYVGHAALLPKKPTLKFSQKQEMEGRKFSKKIGIHDSDWFVCLHNRSSDYLKRQFVNRDFSQHNIRDCSFNMLFHSAEFIKKKGGKCIRMSSGEKTKLGKHAPDNIIDYATKWQTDFMDIYLPAKCKFFLGSQNGLLNVPQIFNVPVASTNCIPVNAVSVPRNSFFIPKMLWLIEEKRFLNYKEITEKKLEKYIHIPKLKSMGIEVIENDNDDIKLLVEDIFDHLEGKRISSKDEKTRDDFMDKYFLENKFTNKYSKNEKLKYSGKISWRFLLKHSYLMDV